MPYVKLIQASNASPDRKAVLDQIDRAFGTVPIASLIE